MKHKFKHGDAVLVYSETGCERLFWGRKMGAYRVLSSSSNAEALDAGPCVSESEVGKSIFPAPDASGKFADSRFWEVIESKRNGRLFIKLRMVQVGPSRWAAGIQARYGVWVVEEVPHLSKAAETWEDAASLVLMPVITEMIGRMHQATTRTARAYQLVVETLANQLPYLLQGNIIKLVKQAKD